jgi:uncharacterized protein (DUF4415 family)
MATVKTTLDPNNLPEPSKEALARFDAIGEGDIDYSDIPELDEAFFNKATKSSVTVRLDSDMVAWFKSQGKGYQTRMNAVLRAFYEHHQSK